MLLEPAQSAKARVTQSIPPNIDHDGLGSIDFPSVPSFAGFDFVDFSVIKQGNQMKENKTTQTKKTNATKNGNYVLKKSNFLENTPFFLFGCCAHIQLFVYFCSAQNLPASSPGSKMLLNVCKKTRLAAVAAAAACLGAV